MAGAPAVGPVAARRARRPRPLRVGLTGGLACGKSTVAALFREQGAPVLDADLACHELLAGNEQVRAALRRRFGAEFPVGRELRPALRARLEAGGAEDLDWLEGILHGRVYRRLEAAWAALPAVTPYCLLMVPLLLESSGVSRVDRVLVVDCPLPEQRRRVVRRAGGATIWIDLLLRRQCGRVERLAAAHECIDNGGPPSALRPQVRRLHRRYRYLGHLQRPGCPGSARGCHG